jgi:hypothetical protein
MGSNKPTPEIHFSIEIRPVTPKQREAGNRLLKKLIERAQARNKPLETAEARARVEAEAPPAAEE